MTGQEPWQEQGDVSSNRRCTITKKAEGSCLRPIAPEDLPALVEAWNACFVGGPNYIRINEADFVRRVTGQPSFAVDSLLVAFQNNRLCGFVHYGPRANLWSNISERRVNRTEGQIYMLVAPPKEKTLLKELLSAAESNLKATGARKLVLGTSWVYGGQPYYNGIAGAYEIPGLSPQRTDVMEVAASLGFTLAAEYGTPQLDAAKLDELRVVASNLWPCAREWGLRKWVRPVESAFFSPRMSVELIRGREIVAMTAFGLWEEYAREYGRRLYGLASVQVATQWRGLGLGKLVVIEAMLSAQEQGAEGFHLHVWRANEVAWNLYHRALGFQPTYRWVTLEKALVS